MERTEHLLTPASLKALAHPLRVRLLGLLRADGPSTATALGRRVGESSGTTSYHLRQLAAADFVVEDATRGNGRERWWRAAQDATRLESASLDDDPATLAAVDAYLGAVARMYAARLDTWIATGREWPKPWREAGGMSDQLLSLSAAELVRLNSELDAVVESYRREPKRGDQRVAVHWTAFPVRADG
jgi:DNA-binding transcriptional ArsR family regulator